MSKILADLFTFITNLALFCLILTLTVGAWIQHVITCIAEKDWILLAFGIFVPPIGWVHGIGVWFGVF